MASQLSTKAQIILERGGCTEACPVRRTTRKKKGGGDPRETPYQSAPSRNDIPAIELDQESPEDEKQLKGDAYIIPKLPLSALDVPGPAGELSIPALRQTKRLVHHCK
jgi:hypothetical protein